MHKPPKTGLRKMIVEVGYTVLFLGGIWILLVKIEDGKEFLVVLTGIIAVNWFLSRLNKVS